MTANNILNELKRLGVSLVVDADRLRYRPREAVGPELLARLRKHKRELLGFAAGHNHHVDPWPTNHNDPAPCPQCGGLTAWESLGGGWKCANCNPPMKAIKTLEKAERIRRQHGLSSPEGTAELLEKLKIVTSSCNKASIVV